MEQKENNELGVVAEMRSLNNAKRQYAAAVDTDKREYADVIRSKLRREIEEYMTQTPPPQPPIEEAPVVAEPEPEVPAPEETVEEAPQEEPKKESRFKRFLDRLAIVCTPTE